VREPHSAGLEAIAITDHDTLAAHDTAAPIAAELGVELVRGIELSCKYGGRNVHLLGYFFDGAPGPEFTTWLRSVLDARRERNCRLARKLQDLGIDVELEEAERLGRGLTGRPHFARVIVDKGYAANIREAFDRYLGEYGTAFVEREAPAVSEAIQQVLSAGGLASLAHPVRVAEAESAIAEFAAAGLTAIEAFHTDQGDAETASYLQLAEKFGLAISGGSDFHGANKPNARLGRCAGGHREIPGWIVDRLRERAV
jgi:predicted metal-dependent phosphoesterase TrpH